MIIQMVNYGAVEHKVWHHRQGHSSAKTFGFSKREAYRSLWLIVARGDSREEPIDPYVRIHIKIEKIQDVSDRSPLQLPSHGFPGFPKRGSGDPSNRTGEKILTSG